MKKNRRELEKSDILHMQVRLFRLACKRWRMDTVTCAELFDLFRVDELIKDLYGLFHVQGDDANMDEIEAYLKARGVRKL